MAEAGAERTEPVFVDAYEARRVGAALRRHGLLVTGLAVLFAIGGGVWSVLSPPVYRAEAVILVNIHAVRIGADGIAQEAELIPPARRTVGTICQSDLVTHILSARMAGEPEPDWPDQAALEHMISDEGFRDSRTKLVRDMHPELYFDQLSQEMAALRAADSDPQRAADIANTWAEISRQMLLSVYGTTQADIDALNERIVAAEQDVVAVQKQADASGSAAPNADRLRVTSALDRARALLDELNLRHARLTARMHDSRQIAQVINPAVPPSDPINASAGLVAALFGLAGLFLGLALALFRGQRALA